MPTHRTIARRRRASINITPRFHRRGTPACPGSRRAPKNAKRTQSHKPNRQNMQNEPNLRLPQLAPRSKYAKRTQSTPGQQPIANSQKLLFTKRTQFTPPPPRPTPQLCETNPISRRRGPVEAKKRETNPIYPTIYKPQYTIYNIQYTIPCPNSQTPKQRLTLYV